MTNRNTLAASGLANTVRNTCSSARPVIPTGIVAMTISHARRSSASRATIRRARTAGPRPRRNARMIRTQSSRKNHSSATAVAQCSATMYAR